MWPWPLNSLMILIWDFSRSNFEIAVSQQLWKQKEVNQFDTGLTTWPVKKVEIWSSEKSLIHRLVLNLNRLVASFLVLACMIKAFLCKNICILFHIKYVSSYVFSNIALSMVQLAWWDVYLNSAWPSNGIWPHKDWSILVKVLKVW